MTQDIGSQKYTIPLGSERPDGPGALLALVQDLILINGGGIALVADAAARAALVTDGRAFEGLRVRQVDTAVSYDRVGSAWVAAPGSFYCAMEKSGGLTLTNATTNYAVPWDIENSDKGGLHESVTNPARITAPVDGLYEISYNIYLNQGSGSAFAFLGKNGVATQVTGSLDRRVGAAGVGVPLCKTAAVVLAAGDYVELWVQSTVAATGLVGGATGPATSISARYVGPA